MAELGIEERARLKKHLGIASDEQLDAWLESARKAAEEEHQIPTEGLDDREITAIQHQQRLLKACWKAAQGVAGDMPSDSPAFPIEAFWKVVANLAMRVHAQVNMDLREPRR